MLTPGINRNTFDWWPLKKAVAILLAPHAFTGRFASHRVFELHSNDWPEVFYLPHVRQPLLYLIAIEWVQEQYRLTNVMSTWPKWKGSVDAVHAHLCDCKTDVISQAKDYLRRLEPPIAVYTILHRNRRVLITTDPHYKDAERHDYRRRQRRSHQHGAELRTTNPKMAERKAMMNHLLDGATASQKELIALGKGVQKYIETQK